MKKTLLRLAFAIAAVIGTHPAFAQFGYRFAKLQQTYAPLTSTTSLSKGALWNSDSVYAVPLGFSFKLAGNAVSKIYLIAGNYISATPDAARQSGFIMLGTALTDRGQNIMSSKSDIRYTTSGSAGSRIFKLEIFNAGFDDEYFKYGELKDSISLQVWLYEGTNVLEYHYGPSRVSNFSDYFFGGLMRCGYVKNMDTVTGQIEKFYLVHETAAATSIDSIRSFTEFKGLPRVPGAGSVFRFTPASNPTGIGQLARGTLARVYPTQCSGNLSIANGGSEPVNYAIINTSGQIVLQGVVRTGFAS